MSQSEDVAARCNAVEECYELMLAYAGQGLTGREPSASTTQVRHYLERSIQALSGLVAAYAAAVKEENLEPAETYQDFLAVLERDAQSSIAAIRIVLAQTILSSQLIDNLN